MEGRARVIEHGNFTTDDSCLASQGVRGIMAKGPTFTCVELDSDNELKVLCTLTTINGYSGPVIAIGSGYFGIGRQIFKFGIEEAVCTLPMDIEEKDVIRVIDCTDSADTIIMHASLCEPVNTFAWLDAVHKANVVIQHFKLDGTCVAKLVCCVDRKITGAPHMVFWKNHIVVSNWNGHWSVIDCMTGQVTCTYQPQAPDYENPSFSLTVINHGRQMAVHFGETREYYDESQECDEVECEPVVRLLATLDIMDGLLVETLSTDLQDVELAHVVKQAFDITGRYRVNYNREHFIYMPDILHSNRIMRQMMRHVNSSKPNSKPKPDDEVLIHLPTSTILPIRGSDLHKDITIIDSQVSTCGTYTVMLVTARDSHDTRLQICALNMQTGKADCATIALFSHYDHQVTARLHGFINGNKAVMYSRTNADGIETVVKQPIFNGVLDCKAEELFNTLDGTLPLEVTRHIVNFM